MYLIKIKSFVFTEKNVDNTRYYYYRFIVLFKTRTSPYSAALCFYKRKTHEGESKFFQAHYFITYKTHQRKGKRDFF